MCPSWVLSTIALRKNFGVDGDRAGGLCDKKNFGGTLLYIPGTALSLNIMIVCTLLFNAKVVVFVDRVVYDKITANPDPNPTNSTFRAGPLCLVHNNCSVVNWSTIFSNAWYAVTAVDRRSGGRFSLVDCCCCC